MAKAKRRARKSAPKQDVTVVSVHFHMTSDAGRVNHLPVIQHLVRLVRAGTFRTMVDPTDLLWGVLYTTATVAREGEAYIEITEDSCQPPYYRKDG